MHARELVQLAEYVAAHGPRVVQSRVAIPEAALELYWTASRCRLDRWSRALRALAAIPFEMNGSCENAGQRVDAGVLDEILLSDVLCRVWTAICRASDRIRGCEDAGPVATSVLSSQSEARQRVLNLMVYGQGIGVENAVNLNRRRLKHEQRTDWLLSCLVPQCDTSDLAFDSARVSRWALAKRIDLASCGPDWTASLCRAAMAFSLPKSAPHCTGNQDLNRKIACAIVGSFPASVFDTTGCLGSARYLALWQATADTHGRVRVATPTDEVSDVEREVADEFRRRHGRSDRPPT